MTGGWRVEYRSSNICLGYPARGALYPPIPAQNPIVLVIKPNARAIR